MYFGEIFSSVWIFFKNGKFPNIRIFKKYKFHALLASKLRNIYYCDI